MARLIRAIARAVLCTIITALLEHLARVLFYRLTPVACRLA